jgi:hypothetical protein
LSDRQIQDYLNYFNRPDLWQEIQINVEFLDLARTPLLLSMMVVAYQGRAIQTKQDLFDAYIERRFNLLPVGKGEPQRRKIIYFLAFLAKRLQKTQTEFLIENMQPDWLQNRQQKWLYKIIRVLMGGLVGLLGGLTGGLILGLTEGFGGLIGNLILGLTIGLFGLVLDSSSIEAVEEIQLSVKRLKIRIFIKTFTLWLIHGLITGLILGLEKLIGMLIIGLIGGLIFGLVKGLKSDLTTKFKPNQGIWASLTNTLFMTVLITVIFSIIRILLFFFNPTLYKLIEDINRLLNFSQIIAFFFGLLSGGGLACIKHVSLRLVLWRSGYIPWNYAQFLNLAAQRRLIQQVGGRYRFIHRLLLDHFANMRLS